ncbi:MAG: transglycosylase domain-containing protein [Austwickia sp.]|nr:transglycosylase domain-containing protein [Austwickia sp.]
MSQPQGPGRHPRPSAPAARGSRGASAPRGTPRGASAGSAGRRTGSPPRKTSRWRRFFLVTGLGGLAVVLLGILGFLWVYSRTAIPNVNDVSRSETSILYFADGRTELARVSAVNRESISLAEIPAHVRNAMLSAEDRGFYDNPGISPTGLGRAVWSAVRGEATQGGSTITQQYVKNSRLTSERTPVAQAQRDHHQPQDRTRAVQGRDPGELLQHHLLRPRLVRDQDCGEGLLQQAGQGPDGR